MARRQVLHEVVVIGGGPAGLMVADRLHRLGRTVTLLEAGPRRFPNPSLLPGEEHSDEQVARISNINPASAELADEKKWRYQILGASGWWARAYALGGRGNLWGGWLSRFDPEVFRDGGWPFSARGIASSYRAAELWLGALRGPRDERFTRAARELGVALRPGTFATRLGCGFRQGVPRQAHCESIALRIEPSQGRSVVHVITKQRASSLNARAVILAASPVETTRILLESEVNHPWLGRRLTDHHMLGYILFEPNRPPTCLPGAIRLPTAVVAGSLDLGVNDEVSVRSGYTVELMGPASAQLLHANTRRLLEIPDRTEGSFTYVNAIGEQLRHEQRRIELAPRARDALGRRIPRVHFAWSETDVRMVEAMKAACRNVAEAISSPGSELLRCRDPFVHPAIYHPAGSCGMATDSAAPCDARGGLRGLPNVWVADASVFPSGGNTHPTLTVLAHAARVADDVDRKLGRSGRGVSS